MGKIAENTRPALDLLKPTENVSLSELFHENTKLHPLATADMIPQDIIDPSDIKAMSQAYKCYPQARQIILPRPQSPEPNPQSFHNVIQARRTQRDFSDNEITLEVLSLVLHQTYGITGDMPIPNGGTQHFRAAPSGGAMYPAEIYLGIRRVRDVTPGIYHYNVRDHALELLSADNPEQSVYEAFCRQEYALRASVTMMISGVMPRNKRKYGERGYRYILLDVGHLAQNLYLSCTAHDLAIMTTCGFFDDELNRLLQIDGVDEAVLYGAFLGARSTDPKS